MRVPRTPRTSRASGCGYVVTLPIARQASLGASGWHKASAGASPRPGAGRAGDCSRQDGRQPSTSFSTTEQSMMVGEEACLWCFPLVDGRESPAGSSRAFQAAQLEQGRGSREQGCSRSFPWRRWRGRLTARRRLSQTLSRRGCRGGDIGDLGQPRHPIWRQASVLWVH